MTSLHFLLHSLLLSIKTKYVIISQSDNWGHYKEVGLMIIPSLMSSTAEVKSQISPIRLHHLTPLSNL